MKKFIFRIASLSIAILVFFTACKKEELDPDRAHISDLDWPYYVAADFGCAGITTAQYFSCMLDDKEFCRNATGTDTSFSSKGQIVITDDPYITVGGNNSVAGYIYEIGIKDKDWVCINGNYFTDDSEDESTLGLEVNYFNIEDFSWDYLLDSIIHTQTNLQLCKLPPGFAADTSGFLVEINLICESKPGNGGTARINFTSGGPQPPTSYLRCTEKIKEDRGSHYAYFLTFEFACNLYSDNQGEKLWRKLEDGRMKLEIHVNK